MTSKAQIPEVSDGPRPPVGGRMLADAREAPALIARLLERNADACAALAHRLRETPPPFAVTCARGSSDSAATYGKYLLEIKLGVVTASIGPSVSSVYRGRPHMKGALFLAISQSGRSPDLAMLAKSARVEGALTVAIVNDETSPLAEISEIVLPLGTGSEGIAATKSYIASLAAILQLAALWSGDETLIGAVQRLPDDLRAALAKDWSEAIALLRDARSLYVIGRGPGLGIAQELAIKLKETCGLHAEAMSAAELMHGPQTLAGPDFPVLAVAQNDESISGMRDTISVLTGRGVPVIVAGTPAVHGTLNLPIADGLVSLAEPIAIVQSFYPLAVSLARARGRNPDAPPHLLKVTETI
jgi:glucosamine--fructose-6-phosphate aminotransferase (isomerizing)